MSPALQHELALGWQLLLFGAGAFFGAFVTAWINSRRSARIIAIWRSPPGWQNASVTLSGSLARARARGNP